MKYNNMRKFHSRLLCGKIDRINEDPGDLREVIKDTKRRNKSYIISNYCG